MSGADVSDLEAKIQQLEKKLATEKNFSQHKLQAELKKKDEHYKALLSQRERDMANMRTAYEEALQKRKTAMGLLQEKLAAAAAASNKLKEQKDKLKFRVQQYSKKQRASTLDLKQSQEAMEALRQGREEMLAQSASERGDLERRLGEEVKKWEAVERRLEEKEKELHDAKFEVEKMKDNALIRASARAEIAGVKGAGPVNGKPVKLIHNLKGDHITMRWSRSFKDSKYSSILGEVGAKQVYIPTVDDVGAVLRCEAFVGSDADAQDGDLVSASAEFGPVLANDLMVKDLANFRKKSELIIPVLSATDPKSKLKRTILLNKNKVKLRKGNKTFAKGVYHAKNITVVLDHDTTNKFLVGVEESGNLFSYQSSNAYERDLVVATIRLFNLISLMGKKPDSLLATKYLLQLTNGALGLGGKAGSKASPSKQPKLEERSMTGGSFPTGSSPTSSLQPSPAPFEIARPRAIGRTVSTPSVSLSTTQLSRADRDSDEDKDAWGKAGGVDEVFATRRKEAEEEAGRREGDDNEPERDADGFIIENRDRGFSNYAKRKDSDDSSDEEPAGPAIKVEINLEKKVDIEKADFSGFALAAPPGSRQSSPQQPPAKRSEKDEEGDEGEAQSPSRRKQKKDKKKAKKKKSKKNKDNRSIAEIKDVVDEETQEENVLKNEADHQVELGESRDHTPSAATDVAEAKADPSLPAQVGTQGQGKAESGGEESMESVENPSSPLAEAVPTGPVTGVKAVVCDILSVKIAGTQIADFSIRGEVNLYFEPPPTENTVFFFSLENLDGLRKIVPNRSCLYRPSPGVYGARIPKGSETVCVLKYKVQTENVDPTEKIPIAVKTTWSQNQQDDLEARLDVDYAVSDTFGPLTSVRFLCGIEPQNSISKCAGANPKCLWNPKNQKIMWKIPELPVPGTDGFATGKLLARLQTTSSSLVPASPVTVSFACNGATQVPSGLVLSAAPSPADSNAGEHIAQCSLKEVCYVVKSGNISVGPS